MRERSYRDSNELCEQISARTGGKVILSFSLGKDSIATWLQLKRYFKTIIPVYYYLIPNLSFVEKSLTYYEEFFKTKIYRFPNPNLLKMLNTAMYQTEESFDIIKGCDIPIYKMDDMFNQVRVNILKDENVFVGTGVRASDNLTRFTTIKVYGAVNENRKQFFPVYDWNKQRLVDEFDRAKVKLPYDYAIWGCSFDGLHYKFLKGVYDNYPDDFAKIKEFFPLIESELYRYKFWEKYNV
jgi:3'-phosphoadenosine 5'-phosphosulfate sulfotransferase (PAPS reductase)/FAD synthetase